MYIKIGDRVNICKFGLNFNECVDGANVHLSHLSAQQYLSIIRFFRNQNVIIAKKKK